MNKQAKAKERSATYRAARHLEQQLYLTERGWSRHDSQWRHPTLKYGWPLDDAYRLQRSADHGARGLCFQALREHVVA